MKRLCLLLSLLLWFAVPAVQAEPSSGDGAQGVLLPYAGDATWAVLPPGRQWGAPSGLAMAVDGRGLWVAERCGDDSCAESDLHPILRFDPDGKLLTQFGSGRFVYPHGIDVDRQGNVYVTDAKGDGERGHQVLKFSPDGKLLLALGKAGVPGEGPDRFNMPSDVAVAANGDIFVADGHLPLTTNMRIVKFSATGEFIKAWGGRGSRPGELDDPHGLAFDSQGRLFVADRGNKRIQIFDQEGNFIAAWTQFGTPSGLHISADDTLYVADTMAGIYVGSAVDGVVNTFIKAPTVDGAATRVAESIAVDRGGRMFVGENAGKRLLVIDPPAMNSGAAR